MNRKTLYALALCLSYSTAFAQGVDRKIQSQQLATGVAAANLGFTPLSPANNLSDILSATTARTNLGLTPLAVTAAGAGVLTAIGNAVGTAGGLALYSANSGAIPNVSGSAQNTTATCTASNTSLTLALAKDFVNGQGIALEHCGATFTGSAPTGVSVSATGDTQQGPTGSTTYNYSVACLDDNGGVGAAVAATAITNGVATLGAVQQATPPATIAYNKVVWTSSCSVVAVWRNIASAGYHLIAVVPRSIFYDTGAPQITVPWIPDTPPGSALSDRFVTTVSAGGGTTTLTLAAAPTTSGTTIYTRHDDTTALNTYFNSTVQPILPAGTYNVEQLSLPSTVGSLTGAGPGATFIQGWNGSSTTVSANGLTRFTVSRMSITAMSMGATALTLSSMTQCAAYNLWLAGDLPITMYGLNYCSVHDNNINVWYSNIINDSNGLHNKIYNNVAAVGWEPAYPSYGILAYNSTYEEIYSNKLLGGTFFGIGLATSDSNQVYHNTVLGSEREAIHISGSGSANTIQANYVNGGTFAVDFCVSLSDDTQNGISQYANAVKDNYLVNCGTSGIAVLQFGGTSPVLNGTIITGNVIANSNQDHVSSTPDIALGGVAVVGTIINGNTFQSGASRVNYNIVEQNYFGVPSYTQVGTSFGSLGASGNAYLAGTGSAKLTGGGTGL